ncbi:hypothetical protein [Vibrio casei]|uniref:hypothetical protein n=1 Tax=Vibrio casei TaxID=673372 RepID=UPI003F9AF635
MTESNNIFIPFAYCSIERASSFLTEALGQTITIEDIEHLIDIEQLKATIVLGDKFDSEIMDYNYPTISYFIGYKISTENYKNIDEYNEHNAPKELKEFVQDNFEAFPSVQKPEHLMYLDNRYVLSKLISPDENSDPLINNEWIDSELNINDDGISYTCILRAGGVWEINNTAYTQLKESKVFTFSELTLKGYRSKKYEHYALTYNLTLAYENIQIKADDIRKIIVLKDKKESITYAPFFDRQEDSPIEKAFIQRTRIDANPRKVISTLVKTHPELGESLLKEPSAGGITLKSFLDQYGVDISERTASRYLGAK